MIRDDCVHEKVCYVKILADSMKLPKVIPHSVQELLRSCDCKGCKHYSPRILSLPCSSQQSVYAVKACMPEDLQEQYHYLQGDITHLTIVRVSLDNYLDYTYRQILLEDDSRNFMYFSSFFKFEDAVGEYLFYDEEDAKTALEEVKHNENS